MKRLLGSDSDRKLLSSCSCLYSICVTLRCLRVLRSNVVCNTNVVHSTTFFAGRLEKGLKNCFRKPAGQAWKRMVTRLVSMVSMSHSELGQTWDRVGQEVRTKTLVHWYKLLKQWSVFGGPKNSYLTTDHRPLNYSLMIFALLPLRWPSVRALRVSTMRLAFAQRR
jgi:hypothetical protein